MRVISFVLFLSFTCNAAAFTEPSKVCTSVNTFGYSQPDPKKVDLQKFIELTRWVEKSRLPIFSFLVSVDGKIIYEMYTSKIEQDRAHYVFSVSKSITSLLVGAAIDRGMIKNTEQTFTTLLPRSLFGSDEGFKKFSKITLKDAMGMSAISTPHSSTDTFFHVISRNRPKLALEQDILKNVGQDFHYTEHTAGLVGATVQVATKKTLFDFAQDIIFRPLDFKNTEWVHQDAATFDNCGYGLRIRPVDMQKLGILMLNQGCWNTDRIISEEWVRMSMSPWMKSSPQRSEPDYGWFWWRHQLGKGWSGHGGVGKAGQNLAIFPEKQIVVTMTADLKDGLKNETFKEIMSEYVIPAFQGSTMGSEALAAQNLKNALQQLQNGESRISFTLPKEAVPSVERKESHRPFSY